MNETEILQDIEMAHSQTCETDPQHTAWECLDMAEPCADCGEPVVYTDSYGYRHIGSECMLAEPAHGHLMSKIPHMLFPPSWYGDKPDDDEPRYPDDLGRCLQCGAEVEIIGPPWIATGCPCFDGPAEP